jgi:hypothetical protein
MVVGLGKSDALSKLVFNVSVERCITMWKQTQVEQCPAEKWQCLPHADDGVVLGFAVRRTVEAIKYMALVASQVGLTINASKITNTINRKKTVTAPKEIEMDIRKC